jgi:hypothetical protein
VYRCSWLYSRKTWNRTGNEEPKELKSSSISLHLNPTENGHQLSQKTNMMAYQFHDNISKLLALKVFPASVLL